MSCQVKHAMSCVCEFDKPPVVKLRGLCLPLLEKNLVDSTFTPQQLSPDSGIVFWQGNRHTKLNAEGERNQWQEPIGKWQWTLTSSVSKITAVTDAPQRSYALGKHLWEVSGDTLCNATKPYKWTLKLTGCNQEGEFTCDDGQCIKMEQRCNQLPNCRDESDELNCQMLLLKNCLLYTSPSPRDS